MIDPTRITKYRQSDSQLEETILFWICAAGKNGTTSARCLDNLLSAWWVALGDPHLSPFEIIEEIDKRGILAEELKRYGIGCYHMKADYFRSLLAANLNLKKCTVEELEAVKGIGPKTARCFLIHSRKNQPYAGLDTHVLKFLRDKGHEVPASTPTGKKYKELEQIFLKYVKDSGKSVAEFDLEVWNDYRSRPQTKSRRRKQPNEPSLA